VEGYLAIIAGFTCSGKSTLTNYLLTKYPKCEIITTYTTRPPRDGERSGDSSGYVFLSSQDYLERKAQAQVWDEMDLGEFYYASDPAQVAERVKAGMIVLSPMLLKPIALQQKMGDLYRGVPKRLYLLNTPIDKCIMRAKFLRSPERVRILQTEESFASIDLQWMPLTIWLEWASSLDQMAEKILMH
jgi:hypothetical protein